jgi:branched-chain amino acid transport system substrate-binding protein
MQRQLKLLLLASAACVALSATAHAEDMVLKVGLAAPLTGDYASISEARGSQCMADKINKADEGIKVEIMMEDSRSDPQLTLSLAQKFLDAGAVMVHGTAFPDSLIPMAQMAAGANAFVYSAQITQVEMHESGLTHFVAGAVPDDVGASASASVAYAKGARTAALLTSDSAGSWSAGTPVWFGEAFEKLGGKVIGTFNHTIGTSDWSPQIADIMKLEPKPDIVYISSIVPDVGILAKQLSAAGYKGLVGGSDGFDDPSLETTVGDNEVLSRVIFNTHTPLVGAPGGAFLEECKAAGFAVNNIFDAMGGDVIRVLVDAAKEAGTTTDGAAILNVIKTRDSFDLVTGGKVSFKEKGTWPIRTVPVIGFEDGKRVVLANETPAFFPHSK